MNFRNLLKLAIKLAFSVALVWWVLRTVDRDVLVQHFFKISVLTVIILTISTTLLSVILALRWRLILSHLGTVLTLRHVISITLLSTFFNQTLPSTLGGDILRAWAARRSGATLGLATNSVIIDRIIALLALLIMGTLAIPYLLFLTGGEAAVYAIIGIIGGGIASTAILAILHKLPHSWTSWPVIRGLMNLSKAFVSIMGKPRIFLPALGHSFVIHLGIVIIAFFIGLSLDSRAIFSDYLVIIPTVILVSSLPISIAGWGIREGAMVVGMGLVGIPSDIALAVSILLGGLFVLVGLVCAGLWYLDRLLPGGNPVQIPAEDKILATPDNTRL